MQIATRRQQNLLQSSQETLFPQKQQSQTLASNFVEYTFQSLFPQKSTPSSSSHERASKWFSNKVSSQKVTKGRKMLLFLSKLGLTRASLGKSDKHSCVIVLPHTHRFNPLTWASGCELRNQKVAKVKPFPSGLKEDIHKLKRAKFCTPTQRIDRN